MEYLAGIDVGTTGVKILIIDEKGDVKGSITVEYPLFTPKPGWAEQNPSDWWEATVKGIKGLLEKTGIKGTEIKGIGLTGQMHGSVFLNNRGDVIHPAILWCDQRTAKECEEITEKVRKERVFEITCNPVLTGFQAPKIIWLKKNHPEVYKKISKVLLPKDYIRFCLTGTFATDVADASGTSLFDVKNRRWSEEILDALDIPSSFLPECFESPEVTGYITEEVSALTGLAKGTPVVAGAGDQAAGGVGSGIVEEGLVSVSIGTSGVVFAHLEDVFVDPEGRLHTFCHAVPGKWHIMGVMLSAGGSFRWLRDIFFGRDESYKVMTDMAETIPAGSEGLLFLPYLTGERCPYPDPDARGVFFGISLKHRKEHLVRAVMEGVSFGLKDSIKIMKEIGVPGCVKFRLTGGGAKSDLWCGMMADIFNGSTVRLKVEEGPSFGAAILAGVGAGIYSNVKDACKKLVKEEENVFKPDKENTEIYEKFYILYGDLYKNLAVLFDNLAKIS
ncbi:MAG TPA: xylulokinase [bacterium]|nr:xylulokinase [bacterium]HPP30268.1 xylulokinase [bacterium]